MPNTINGFYSSNSLVHVQQSGPVCLVPNKGPSFVLNNGKNLSNKSSGCPLVLYTCNVVKRETELSTPVGENSKFLQDRYNKSKDVLVGGTVLKRSSELPFSGAQYFHNKELDSTNHLGTKMPSTVSSHQNSGGNTNGNQLLTHYTGTFVPARVQPVIYSHGSSEKTVLTLPNLKSTIPDVKNIVQGKSVQPAAYLYTFVGENSITSTSFHPSNFSSVGVLSSPKPVNSEASGQLSVNNIGYKCPICSVRFNTESDRSLHIHKIHDKKCPYCTEVFSSTSGRCYRSLLKHVVLCHKDKDPCSVAHKSTIESALRGKESDFVLHFHKILNVLTSDNNAWLTSYVHVPHLSPPTSWAYPLKLVLTQCWK